MGTVQEAGDKSTVLPMSPSDELRLTVETYGVEDGGKEASKKTLLETVPEAHRVRVHFSGVDATVPLLAVHTTAWGNVKGLWSKPKGEDSLPVSKQILFGMEGEGVPCKVLAMMGPSGSGKTTLLSILGGRQPKTMTVGGTILYNGRPLEKAIKRRVGFVTQDDVMYETLTVYETLYYAALLRLPKEMTRVEKKRRVEIVISALGLEKCRDTIVGGFMMRGVSGGERKRVAVGHELLTNPSVLMLDEPTSGLDATTAMHLLTVLRKLAEGGRSIITTIHQPSSRLYQQLDTVMLLSQGRTMYYGDAKLVLGWFTVLGKPVPLGVNIADFILDLSSGNVPDGERTGEEVREKLVSSFTDYTVGTVGGVTKEAEVRDYRPGKVLSVHEQTNKPAEGFGVDSSDVPEKWGAGFLEQLEILSSRTMRTRRLEAFGTTKYVTSLGVALIGGLLWWQAGADNTLLAASDVSGLLFFSMIFAQANAMFSSVFTFPSEFQMMVKERSSGMYRLSAFYISRSASELPLDCFIPTLYVTALYFACGLKLNVASFICHLLSVLLSIFVAQTCGLIIGASIMDFKSATTAATLVLLSTMLTGGYYIKKIPGWISWLKYLSFIYYGYNLLMKIEFAGRTISDCGGLGVPAPVVAGEEGNEEECTKVENLKDALSLSVDVEESVLTDVLALMLMLVLVRIALYYVLKKKTST